jgi:fucose 4-O-acetylase-like acetyltransferase
MPKRHDVEVFRVLGAAMIIWYHAGAYGQEYAYAGLIIFLILSAYLAVLADKKDLKTSLVAKVHRLIVPWFTWVVIYGAICLVMGKRLVPDVDGVVGKLLAGTAPHLWYMPFIFFALLLVDVLKNNAKASVVGLVGGLFSAGMLFSVSIWRAPSIEMGPPFAQYFHAIAAVGIGVFFGQREQMRKHLFLIVFALLIAASIYALPWRGVGATYLIGILCGGVISYRLLEKINFHGLERFAPYTLGIYFVHVLVLWGVTKLQAPDPGEFILTLVFSSILVVGATKMFPRTVKYWA